MIKIENPDDVYNWNTEQLWNAIKQIQEETPEINIDKIKNGNKIKFPIWYIIKNWITERPEYKTVDIKGYGRIKITEYMEEKDYRESQMRKIIFENQNDEEMTEPRVK